MTSLYATVNDSGDLFMLSECRVLIGKRVKVCKRKKNGLYIVYDEELRCTQCDEDHIAVLDFHHSNPEQKEFSISRAISDGISLNKIQDEINKCIVLCSNCHRKLHWNERNMPT